MAWEMHDEWILPHQLSEVFRGGHCLLIVDLVATPFDGILNRILLLQEVELGDFFNPRFVFIDEGWGVQERDLYLCGLL